VHNIDSTQIKHPTPEHSKNWGQVVLNLD